MSGALGGQYDPLELELEVTVSLWMWMLVTELLSSASLNHLSSPHLSLLIRVVVRVFIYAGSHLLPRLALNSQNQVTLSLWSS